MSRPAPMTRKELDRFITEKRIDAQILSLAGHTATVADAARQLGVQTEQIIKSLVFIADGEPLLVINNGLARVDRRKLAAILGLGRKKVRFAEPERVLEFTGFVVGAMPPFGHRRSLRTLVDAAVMDQEVVYGGGGDLNAMLRLTPKILVKATEARIERLSE